MTAPTLTKRKVAIGIYEVHADGRPTGLRIEKATDLRRDWGTPQKWDVVDHLGDSLLFTTKGLEDALSVLETLADHLFAGAGQ